MSLRKSKLDLLVRVRYQNPLPAPPFPPKLLNIPTNPSRYARPDFTAALASETPLPMVVDAEMGMPLDLSKYEALWEDDEDDSALNPDPRNVPPLDPKDQFLLGEPSSFGGPYVNGSSGSSTPVPSMPHVSWLRKTEYISREGVNRAPIQQDLRLNDKPIDVSRAAQIRDIEASFAHNSPETFDLSTLKHPNNPNITAVESYEVLPDVDIWANAYDLFKFSERPGERPAEVDDPRLDCAILRPMESDGDHFLAYYLPKEDEPAESFKQKRRTNEKVDEETIFSFVRDYETVKIEQDVPNEFLLVLDDGPVDVKPEFLNDSKDFSSSTTPRRSKGAYYKNIERKIQLKKKRVNQWETFSYTEKWDAINLTLAPFSQEEREEREETLAEVVDPMYMFSRVDADADGEVDDSSVVPMDVSMSADGGGTNGMEAVVKVGDD
ncbi:RNA polymerase II-associated protein [Rickenella mellea]|uniref:RNA polymerase II-associated protein n=1 Tax=Rickenella mellea TaxID=50990 RepID=A0A4Y7Q8K0_9AGAM|nr:RNA polymerase II-associated protein [Rickenella mellea]